MTKSLVIDASVTVRLVTPHPEYQVYADLDARWAQEGYTISVPSLWVYEITSAICKLHHFGQLTAKEAKDAIGFALSSQLEIVPPDKSLAFRAYEWTNKLRRAAAYDSFYLALAQQLNCDLWTADMRLVNAIAEPWVRFAGTPRDSA